MSVFSCTRNGDIAVQITCFVALTDYAAQADAIEQIVLLQLQKFITFITNDEEAFAQILADKTNKDIKREKKMCETVTQKATSRIATLSNLHQKLYEGNADGQVHPNLPVHRKRCENKRKMSVHNSSPL